jgi:hypothetical protein
MKNVIILLLSFVLIGMAGAVTLTETPVQKWGPNTGFYNYGTIQAGDLYATDDLKVGDDAEVCGDLAVTGAISTGAGTISSGVYDGDLSIAGAHTFYTGTGVTKQKGIFSAYLWSYLNRTSATQIQVTGLADFNRTKTDQFESSTRADLNRTRVTQLDVSALSALNRTEATQLIVSARTSLNRTEATQLSASTRTDLNRTRITQLDVSARSSLNRTAASQFDVSGLAGFNSTIFARPIAQPVIAEQTSSAVFAVTDDKYLIPVDASGANITETLPIATSNAGRSYVVFASKDPGNFYIRITATGGSLIRPRGVAAGSTYLVSTDTSPEVTLTSDGSMYWARTTGTWAQHAA